MNRVSGAADIRYRGAPFDVSELRLGLKRFLETKLAAPTPEGQLLKVGAVKWGVYAFFDYDDEPIYVGQTREQIGTRIRRHLTNQRTDAVAMSVLDPLEVKSVRAWPLPQYQRVVKSGPNRAPADVWRAAADHLNALERLIFERAIAQSRFSAILNEKDPPPTPECDYFDPVEAVLLSDEVLQIRAHPDTRVARRAMTIARLAQVISERELKSGGLRRALVTQAQRLEWLARERYEALGGQASVKQRDRDESESDDETE